MGKWKVSAALSTKKYFVKFKFWYLSSEIAAFTKFLSKMCEKTQCGNFSIFLLLSFYVKSFFKILEVLKCHFLQFWRFWIMIFGQFQPSQSPKIHKKSKFRATKIVKMADFALLVSPLLISRKIWVSVQLSDFNKVKT